jgi:hypothetical protein
MPSDSRDEAKFGIGLPAGMAAQLESAGRVSQERRGKGSEKFREPNPQEKKQLEDAGKASQEKRAGGKKG